MNNLARVRKSKCLSQDDLAKKSGVSRVTIANIERGAVKDVKISTIRKLSKALDESVENIFLQQEGEHNMKVLNEKSVEKVLSLLDAQSALYRQQFRESVEGALIQSAVGLGNGFDSAARIIRKVLNDGEDFNETYLQRIKAVADCEMGKVGYYTDVDAKTEIYWRNEAAALMVAYELVKDFMTEEGEAPISEGPKKNQDGLDDKGQKVIGDHLKKCEDRLWDKMNQCKEAGKEVDPRDRGRAHGFHKGLEYINTYRHNIFGGMKAMETQIKLWNRNTCPAPFEHQSMLASAEALQEVLDLVNIYYTESLECLR